MSRETRPTGLEDWVRSDRYHNSFLLPQDDILAGALSNQAAHGLPDIAVSPAQGKLLKLLAMSIGAKRILEVGTLAGYSTIWLARALPEEGEIVTLEMLEEHAKVARENLANAGFAKMAQVIVGPAADSLAQLHPTVPFDLIFIDADKEGNLTYFTEAKRLVRKGGVIIVDNVVRRGKVGDTSLSDSRIEGVRALLKSLKEDKEIEATTIATVGEKGYDGFLYAIRK